jgi:hypothetical protein
VLVVGVNADGTYQTRNIQAIQVGDRVLTRNADDPRPAPIS